MLQLGFQDDPYFLSLDDISLKATGSAAVRAMGGKAGAFQLVGSTTANTVYQVQYKTNLAQPDWINLGNPVTARGRVAHADPFERAPDFTAAVLPPAGTALTQREWLFVRAWNMTAQQQRSGFRFATEY